MWELHDGAKQIGPLDDEHIIPLIRAGLPATAVVRRVGETDWRGLRTHPPFAVALEQAAQRPAHAPLGPPVPGPDARYAPRVQKGSFIGSGCLVQGFGLAAPLALAVPLGVIGLVLGLVILLPLFIVGSRMSRQWTCGACGNRVESTSTFCPAWRAFLA